MNKRYIDFVPKKKGAGGSGPAGVQSTRVDVKPASVGVGAKSGKGAATGVAVKTAGAAGRGTAKAATRAVTATTKARPTGVKAVRRGLLGQRMAGKRLAPKPSEPKPMEPKIDETKMQMELLEQEELRLEEIFAEVPEEQGRKFGVIEDFSGKFVSTEVEKRPLSGSISATEAKSKKISRISLRSKGKKENKTAVAEVSKQPSEPMGKMKIPERPFVNMEKVEKRPLSRNVYQPRNVVTAPKEEPQGPITIIEKPEKDSRIGLIVTIIITIILGAAAGTVAFLLLPK